MQSATRETTLYPRQIGGMTDGENAAHRPVTMRSSELEDQPAMPEEGSPQTGRSSREDPPGGFDEFLAATVKI
jgi:hypothetical protein